MLARARHLINGATKVDQPTTDFRVYTVEELRAMHPGTVFEHETLGRCIITRYGNIKLMKFKGGAPAAGFIHNEYPWDEPMRLIYAET